MMSRWAVWTGAGAAGVGFAGTLTLTLECVEVTRDVLGVISVEALVQDARPSTPARSSRKTIRPRKITKA